MSGSGSWSVQVNARKGKEKEDVMKRIIECTFNLNSGDFSGNWLEKDFGHFTARANNQLTRFDCPYCEGAITMSKAGLLTASNHEFTCPECGAKWTVRTANAGKIRRRLEDYLRHHIGDAVALAAALGCKLTD